MHSSAHTSPTRVAILASSDKTQQLLSELLEGAGLEIVARDLPSDNFLSLLESVSADVLLVDLSEETGRETDIIDTLLDYDKLPILFNDSSPASGGANALWAKKLARKLAELVCEHAPVTAATILPEPVSEPTLETAAVADSVSPNITTTTLPAISETAAAPNLARDQPLDAASKPPAVKTPRSKLEKPEGAAVNFWVLGASLGGPQAVRQFLAAVKPDLPVAFILAQHIGANHISLLAEQLDRVTPFKVLAGRSGYLLRHHEVVLAPADKSISITEDGYLSLGPAPEKAIYSPSVDDAMIAVAKRYGNMAGTIVFSGMGDDGARGCEAIAEHGGIVWAQDVDSCVISSMPDQARKTNTVTYSANPRMLADQLYRYYSDAIT
ncbi:MAG: chemotaxis protein CheB [Gammaproteobacteria bacterium]|nr:chemotaxis protein CheB [Gammaproteobacteria bacterium]